ncbi:mucin-5AC-like [Ictalurus furcatus]|uniref:mucin-5AC-like n=1 Tax=Ictalurus furcatus TaxID=66913 RepID=UPI0023502FAC|nr:mucin-5AC-like [Ictalurus furcatus]
MIVTLRLLSILSLVSSTESECSSTSYYRNCWIRRFPGLHVDAEESQRRGAQLLQLYRGDSAQNCSRACCLTSNFSCNVAVFHYNTTQDSVNCFHLHCPTPQTCILNQRANVILYNVTKGMDPDLLIFGKSFPSNVQVLPQLASLNTSDLSGTDKRQFNRPHMEPSSSAHPTIVATSPKTSTNAPTSSFPISTPPPFSVYSTQDNKDTFPASALQRSTTLKRPSQLISNPSTDPTIVATTNVSPNPQESTMQPSFSFTNIQTSSMPQPTHTSSTTITPSQLSSQLTSSSTSSSQVPFLGTTTAYTINQTASTEFTTLPYLQVSTTFSGDHTTTTKPVPFLATPQSSTGETTTTPVPLTSTLESSTLETTTMPVPLTTTPRSSTGKTTTMLVPLSSTPQSSTGKTTMLVPLSSTPQSSTGQTTTMTVHLSSIPQSSTGETTTMPVPLSSILQSSKEDSTAHTTLTTAQLISTNAILASTPLNPVKTMTGYVTTTTGPQVMINSFTTTSWSYNQPINTQSTASPLMEKRIIPSSTTGGLSQGLTKMNLAITDVSVTASRPTTLNRRHSSAAAPENNSGLKTSPTPPTTVEDSQPYPNDTKGYISRNVTTGNSPQPVSDGGLTQVFHLAANTVLVALATCAALACGCCCSVLMAASWRGRRRRKGRYQTTLTGKKGSMRLIKYVFVRESS